MDNLPANTEIALNNAKIMSISRADSWTTCQRKHLFSYTFERQADHRSRSLNIGIIGHDVLAVFYSAIMEGLSVKDAEQEAMKKLTEHFARGEVDVEVLSMVHVLVSRYISQDTLATGTKILAVESDFFLPINTDYWYGMRLDLLVEATQGQQKGRILLIDHKFTYDFYTPAALKLNSQMPKYVGTVRYNGYPVEEAYLNQIRTRFAAHLVGKKSDDDLFRRDPVGITHERVRSALKHQMIASERIIERSRMPLEMQIEEALPVLNNMVCRNCPFVDPCIRMEEGVSAEKALGPGYVAKTSGFDYLKEVTGGPQEA